MDNLKLTEWTAIIGIIMVFVLFIWKIATTDSSIRAKGITTIKNWMSKSILLFSYIVIHGILGYVAYISGVVSTSFIIFVVLITSAFFTITIFFSKELIRVVNVHADVLRKHEDRIESLEKLLEKFKE